VRRRAVEVSGRPAGGEELGESGAERGRALGEGGVILVWNSFFCFFDMILG
jgi:hypothetical protein